MNINYLTLKLFSAVEERHSNDNLIITDNGVVVSKGSLWALEDIVAYFSSNVLGANELNKTFYKSWNTILNSSEFDLFIDKIIHYLTTYGADFTGDAYIPKQELDLPEDLRIKYIKSYTKEVLIEKSLAMLQSGIALSQDTIKELIFMLEEFGHKFSENDNIRNKEAIVIIADKYKIYPKDPVEFLRFMIYKSTSSSLLIKNKTTYTNVKSSKEDISKICVEYGLEKLATIFNRFKPIFISFKQANDNNINIINKISRLSKTLHKPMKTNILNEVTSRIIKPCEFINFKSTPFLLLRALRVCKNHIDKQYFCYKIRNGAFFTVNKSDEDLTKKNEICKANYETLIMVLKNKFNFENKTFVIPSYIKYGLPISEKNTVEAIPFDTTVSGNKNIQVGIYWRNEWGAHDFDLSANSLSRKVGWNSSYSNNGIIYSGDITDAPDGATEVLNIYDEIEDMYIIKNNKYYGNDDSSFKLFVAKDEIQDLTENYTVNPNAVLFESMVTTTGKETVCGLIHKKGEYINFTLNMGCSSPNSRISSVSEVILKAFKHDVENTLSLNEVLQDLGANVVDEYYIFIDGEDYIDLSLEILEKDTLMNLFKDE